MPADHREQALIPLSRETRLLAHGYARYVNRDFDAAAEPEGFDRERVLFPGVFAGFVRESQPDT